MAKVLLTLEGFRCERCKHEWVPRDKGQEPTVCPKCKSPYWNKPRKDAEIGEPKPAHRTKSKGEPRK
jgi:predicted Zn-ribbon and HTH transcriptional regulator